MKQKAVLKWVLALFGVVWGAPWAGAQTPEAQSAPVVSGISLAELRDRTRSLFAALEALGRPLPEAVRNRVLAATQGANVRQALLETQSALDPFCLFGVNINPESRVKVAKGGAKPLLALGRRNLFLIKVHNEAGVSAPLQIEEMRPAKEGAKSRSAWLNAQLPETPPLSANLSGRSLEYRPILLMAEEAGKREARIGFHVGQGTQDLGFRGDVDMLFVIQKPLRVSFRALDTRGREVSARIVIWDIEGYRYVLEPAQGAVAMLAPRNYVATFEAEGMTFAPVRFSALDAAIVVTAQARGVRERP